MPLEFVISNAGHPMLVVDHYTFHRHSSNPKTGRTNWRCSRRRVKDIRCPSSCHSIDDTASIPSAHDPNCLPLSNTELMAYKVRREKLSNHMFRINGISNYSHSNDDEENNDINNNHMSSLNFANLSSDSFKDREICSDEEELNEVLHDLNEDVIKDSVQEEIDLNNIDHEAEIKNSYEYDNSNGNEYIDGDAEDMSNENNSTNNDTEINNTSENLTSQVTEETNDSLQQDFIESTSTISGMIESNKKLINHLNKISKTNALSTESHQRNNSTFSNTNNENSVTNPNNNPVFSMYSIRNSNDKSIFFVTSKVGHPMLVVDNYTFHKHSTNPKTGRINWRCARRRVKEIRCSSSCYTVNGEVSSPTNHDEKCFPLTEEMLKSYQNKRAKISTNTFINTKADSFTTLKNKPDVDNNDFDSVDNKTEIINGNSTQNGYRSLIPKSQQSMYRNKRKENLPVRSNENSENCDQFKENFGDYYENDFEYNTDTIKTDNFIDYTDDNNDNINITENGYQEYNDYTRSNSENNFCENGFNENLDEDSIDEFDLFNYSSSPESVSKFVTELRRLKKKESVYKEQIRRVNNEMNRIKKISGNQIQSLKWKTKMMEIDMASFRSNIQQKDTEITNLKKLVDDMISKMK